VPGLDRRGIIPLIQALTGRRKRTVFGEFLRLTAANWSHAHLHGPVIPSSTEAYDPEAPRPQSGVAAALRAGLVRLGDAYWHLRGGVGRAIGAAALGSVVAFIMMPTVSSANTKETDIGIFFALKSSAIITMAENRFSFLPEPVVINNLAPYIEIAPAFGHIFFETPLSHCFARGDDVIAVQFAICNGLVAGISRIFCINKPSDITCRQPSSIAKPYMTDESVVGCRGVKISWQKCRNAFWVGADIGALQYARIAPTEINSEQRNDAEKNRREGKNNSEAGNLLSVNGKLARNISQSRDLFLYHQHYLRSRYLVDWFLAV
jgi:hypothetical protein